MSCFAFALMTPVEIERRMMQAIPEQDYPKKALEKMEKACN
jgi:hypothetical protein